MQHEANTKLPRGTKVHVNLMTFAFDGEVVGLATEDIYPVHIVKCTDGTFPTEEYPYDTWVVPLGHIYLKD